MPLLRNINFNTLKKGDLLFGLQGYQKAENQAWRIGFHLVSYERTPSQHFFSEGEDLLVKILWYGSTTLNSSIGFTLQKGLSDTYHRVWIRPGGQVCGHLDVSSRYRVEKYTKRCLEKFFSVLNTPISY